VLPNNLLLPNFLWKTHKIVRMFLCFASGALISGLCRPELLQGRQNSPKVCLVLSGGGARAASHVGVLEVLEREHIPIDCIAGTSFGALAGGLYSIGYSASEIKQILLSQNWADVFSDTPQRRLTPLLERRNARYQAQISFRGWRPELPTGLWGGQRLSESLDILTTGPMLQARYDFDRLPIQFRTIATNLIDGKAYIFSHGSMTEAIRASIAIPFLFTPLEKDGMLLVDGGLVDNLPTDIARSLGADIVIAVDSTSPLLKKDEIRTFIDVVDQSLSLQMERTVRENRKLADIVLEPDLDGLTYSDYDKLPAMMEKGEEEAERRLDQIKKLLSGVPFRPHAAMVWNATQVIKSISFRGLNRVTRAQMYADVKVRPGDVVDPTKIGADVSRIYGTRLFDSVTYTLEPVEGNRYALTYVVKEAPLRALGVSLRYDNDYGFVGLAEFTARQLFRSPSSAIISSQFGGLENDFAALRMVPPAALSAFVEPRIDARQIERQDVRNKVVVDEFTDSRQGGQLMIGSAVRNQLEIEGGYRAERVTISGGLPPNRSAGASVLAGLTLRLYGDSLDYHDFPHSGMILGVQIDKQSTSLGSDFNYSRWQADFRRYFPFSPKSTIQIQAAIGYTRGPVPFYDQFFIGGYSFSETGSRQFLGLQRDEIMARQMAIVGASYRRQIFSHPLGFFKRGFVTGSYNGLSFSTRQSSPYDFHYLNGAGLGFAMDTIIGPVRASAGMAEGGRVHFYVSLGPAF
jgi:NTE family protein